MTREEEIKEVAKNRANQYSHPVEWYDCYKHWIEGAEWADQTMIEKACDAYCKVCGHFAHTTPTHICRHDCIYYSDFVKQLKE